MQLLHAGILLNPALPCVGCGTVGGTCWCGPLSHHPRHGEGALAGARLLRTKAAL